VSERADFDGFVVARSRALLKTAWLMTGDWQQAEDLLQTALAKAYPAWGRIGEGREEAYVRRVLATTYATWWRRAWRREHVTGAVIEEPDPRDDAATVDLRQSVLSALADLPARAMRTFTDRELSEALRTAVPEPEERPGRPDQWLAQKVIWVFDKSYSGPVLLRGDRIDGRGALGFVHYIGAAGYSGSGAGDDEVHHRVLYLRDGVPYVRDRSDSSDDGLLSSYPGGIYAKGPGCYAVQADGVGFSETLVFRATAP
jgi:hypothetical protein